MITVIDARCEYQVNPVGIFTLAPRFSWKLSADKKNVIQSGYSIELAKDKDFSKVFWQSGFVDSAQSHLVEYKGETLSPSTKYYWRVKVLDNQKEESPWSETSFFRTAFFDSAEWKAAFITGEGENDAKKSGGYLFRKEFTLSKDVKQAVLYASAKGIYEAYCNGSRLGDSVLAPGWTSYKKRILFQTYELDGMVSKGKNALALAVGPGWYKGDLAGWLGRRNVFGSRTAVIAQLYVEYTDGSQEIIKSDESWNYCAAPVTYSELYHGEVYDARLEQNGWNDSDFAEKDGVWKSAAIESRDCSILVPQDGPPVREHEIFKCARFFVTPKGERVIDFGQNISGYVRFKVNGKAGDVVKFRHAEILDKDGNFYTENLRSAKETIEYICKGGGTETYSPHFTFQGFQYICIDEYPGELNPDDFEAVSIYSDVRQTGDFTCSHSLVNRLIRNVRWGIRDNFVDIPTDCPQRDERLGWTGDAEIVSRAASYLTECAPFFRKWLRDMQADQHADGKIPHVIPDVLKGIQNEEDRAKDEAGATAWADAVVIIPWTMYKYFDDKALLEENYGAMVRWVEYIHTVAEKGLLFNTGFHFGDWVALDAKEGSYFGATPNDLTATAFYAYSTELLAKSAAALGKTADAQKYRKLREDIGKGFAQEFFTPNGRLAARTQTAHLLSLVFGLTPPQYLKRTVDTLVELFAENSNHLTTGFLGTPFICKVLADNGHLDLAYELLLKEDYPSWLYPVTKGATTIWEHWDGLKPDGSMWSPDMNSFNHYAYGAISDWIFSVVGGIDTAEDSPGFRRAVIKPCPGGGITWAQTKLETPYGLLAVRWEISDGKFNIACTIPPNTSAQLVFPKEAGGAETQLGCGSYEFSYPYAP